MKLQELFNKIKEPCYIKIGNKTLWIDPVNKKIGGKSVKGEL